MPERERTPTWERPGWVVLAGEAARIYHRRHPEHPAIVMCGLPLDELSLIVGRRRQGWDNCDKCGLVRTQALAAAGYEYAQEVLARPPRHLLKYQPVHPMPLMRPVGTWKNPWWVVPSGDSRRMHRVHPEHAGLTLCGKTFGSDATGYLNRPINVPTLPDCRTCLTRADKARQSKKSTSRQAARGRGGSVWPVSGGLPTLGKRH